MEHGTQQGGVVRDRGSWALAGSAVALSAAIVLLGGRGMVAPVEADVATIGSQTITNLRAGTDEEVIAVLDGREERLFVYQVQNMKDLKLVSSDDLRDIFAKAKAAASGTR
jgi:hypothetical protein